VRCLHAPAGVAGELDAAGVPTDWHVDDADPYDHADPPEPDIDEDAMYEAWRDMQRDHDDRF
jgi:hypothetical protein